MNLHIDHEKALSSRKQSITPPAAAQNSVGGQWKAQIHGLSLFLKK
jgi:hypothetical protein